MYEKVNAAIREVDRETLLFWEPPTWSHWSFETGIPFINNLLINYFQYEMLLRKYFPSPCDKKYFASENISGGTLL